VKRKILIEIEAGEKTCAIEPGKFCEFSGTVNWGMTFICRLFPGPDEAYTVLHNTKNDGMGWTIRCPACLAAEKEAKNALPVESCAGKCSFGRCVHFDDCTTTEDSKTCRALRSGKKGKAI